MWSILWDLLKSYAVEITRHVTEGIRDLVRHDRHIRHLVLNLGAVPLATWAEYSMPALKHKIDEMRYDLEHGKIEGFPGMMVLHGKPTFATLEEFHKIVFEQVERLETG